MSGEIERLLADGLVAPQDTDAIGADRGDRGLVVRCRSGAHARDGERRAPRRTCRRMDHLHDGGRGAGRLRVGDPEVSVERPDDGGGDRAVGGRDLVHGVRIGAVRRDGPWKAGDLGVLLGGRAVAELVHAEVPIRGPVPALDVRRDDPQAGAIPQCVGMGPVAVVDGRRRRAATPRLGSHVEALDPIGTVGRGRPVEEDPPPEPVVEPQLALVAERQDVVTTGRGVSVGLVDVVLVARPRGRRHGDRRHDSEDADREDRGHRGDPCRQGDPRATDRTRGGRHRRDPLQMRVGAGRRDGSIGQCYRRTRIRGQPTPASRCCGAPTRRADRKP